MYQLFSKSHQPLAGALMGYAIAPILTVFALGGMVSAQTEGNQVVLQFSDDEQIEGDLIQYEDGVFQLQTSVGRISIAADDVTCIGAACPAGTFAQVPTDTKIVTLTAVSDDSSIEGKLISHDSASYTIATFGGEMKIDRANVNCRGGACPEDVAEPEPPKFATFSNGETSIEGVVLGIEGNLYIIEHASLGKLRIVGSQFTCAGTGC